MEQITLQYTKEDKMITYKLKIEKLEEEVKSESFTSLLEKGYKVIAYIPVIDNNEPTLIVMMNKEINQLDEIININSKIEIENIKTNEYIQYINNKIVYYLSTQDFLLKIIITVIVLFVFLELYLIYTVSN